MRISDGYQYQATIKSQNHRIHINFILKNIYDPMLTRKSENTSGIPTISIPSLATTLNVFLMSLE